MTAGPLLLGVLGDVVLYHCQYWRQRPLRSVTCVRSTGHQCPLRPTCCPRKPRVTCGHYSTARTTDVRKGSKQTGDCHPSSSRRGSTGLGEEMGHRRDSSRLLHRPISPIPCPGATRPELNALGATASDRGPLVG